MKSNTLMRTIRHIGLIAFLTSLSCYVSAQTNSEVLTNQSVISLVKAGLDKSTILATVNNAASKYDVSTTGIINLKKQGVNSEIINAMIARSSGGSTGGKVQKSTAQASELSMVNHPYFKGSDGKLQPLEKAVAGLKTKRKALGYGGVSLLYEIEGIKAIVRVSQNDSVSFLINTAGTALPELVLYKLKVEKDKRTAVGTEYKTFGGMKSGGNVTTFNTVSVGNGVFKISPSKKLEAGEYFFGGKPVQSATTIDVFAFGVE